MRMMSEKLLKAVEKRFDKKLRKQAQDGLAEVFSQLSCKAIAREIKAGRKVTGNAELGVRICVHPKVGPRFNPTTGKFTPMSAKGKRLEEKFIENVDGLLESGGFRKMSSNLIPRLRKKDRAFKERVKRRT